MIRSKSKTRTPSTAPRALGTSTLSTIRGGGTPLPAIVDDIRTPPEGTPLPA